MTHTICIYSPGLFLGKERWKGAVRYPDIYGLYEVFPFVNSFLGFPIQQYFMFPCVTPTCCVGGSCIAHLFGKRGLQGRGLRICLCAKDESVESKKKLGWRPMWDFPLAVTKRSLLSLNQDLTTMLSMKLGRLNLLGEIKILREASQHSLSPLHFQKIDTTCWVLEKLILVYSLEYLCILSY